MCCRAVLRHGQHQRGGQHPAGGAGCAPARRRGILATAGGRRGPSSKAEPRGALPSGQDAAGEPLRRVPPVDVRARAHGDSAGLGLQCHHPAQRRHCQQSDEPRSGRPSSCWQGCIRPGRTNTSPLGWHASAFPGMGWEPREVFLMLKAMNASLPDWAPETAKRARPVLVDVGANVRCRVPLIWLGGGGAADGATRASWVASGSTTTTTTRLPCPHAAAHTLLRADAQLGAFTLAAAAVQYEVLAFEGERRAVQRLFCFARKASCAGCR